MPVLHYHAFSFVAKILRLFILALPLPHLLTIPTKNGVMRFPKSFRLITTIFDLIEPEIKTVMEEWLKKANYFLDVGSAYGYYALKAAKSVKGQVLTFEPDKSIYKVLVENLALNNIKNVRNFPVALNDENGQIRLGNAKVEACKLDSILKNESIVLNQNDIIKIDVEGMAFEVLKGSEQTLRTAKPKLIIELHAGEENVENFLVRLGYGVSRLSRYFLIAN